MCKAGEVYILAIVENVFETPNVFFIINPIEKLRGHISPRHSTSHAITRTDWLRVANEELDELLP